MADDTSSTNDLTIKQQREKRRAEKVAALKQKQAREKRARMLGIGGAIVGTHAGDMLGEICLAIEMGCDATDIGKTIHAHPTLGESIGMAAEVAHGSCTDLPPQRKK